MHPCASGPSALAIGLINRSTKEEHRVQVLVRDNNVDQALRVLKKKMQREGLLPMKPRAIPGALGRGGPPRAPRF
jgi:pentatricopeptide repeat protein